MSLIKTTWSSLCLKASRFLSALFLHTTKLHIDYYFFFQVLTNKVLTWLGWLS